MRVSKGLVLAAWVTFATAVALHLGASHASAHKPYIVVSGSIWSWGANAVHNNVAANTPCGNGSAKTVAIMDYYGLPSGVESSSYYPDPAWDSTYICATQSTPVEGGTAIYVYSHDGHSPTATHIHTWTWVWRGYWSWEEDNNLSDGPAFVGDIHLTSGSANCSYGGTGNCGAHVIAHEVGHALGLDDECGSDDGSLMYKTSSSGCSDIPYLSPSSGDKRTAEICIMFYPWSFPC